MEFRALVAQNPWWGEIESIKSDFHIQQFEGSPIKWQPPVQNEFDLTKDSVYILRGPRQVGKTTLLKRMIRDLLLLRNTDPRSVFCFACDMGGIRNDQSMKDLLETYLSWARNLIPNQRLFIFLDEVTYTENWATGLKVVADQGKLANVTVITTGSHAVELRRGGERMPGRRGMGAGLDKELLPMSFREYVRIVDPTLADKLSFITDWNPQQIHERALAIALFDIRLQDHFRSYLITGGFPRAVAQYFSQKFLSKELYDIYLQAILGDIAKLGRREDYVRQLVFRIFEKMANPVDWRTLVQETEIGAHKTVGDYALDLEQMFIWHIVYHVTNLGEAQPAFKKRRKLYFQDPLIFHALRSWSYGFPDPYKATTDFLLMPRERGVFVEGIVASHLIRNFGQVFYWRKDEEDEIDFIVYDARQHVANIEVKYQAQINPSNARRLVKSGGGLLLTQTTLALSPQKEVIALPVAYFLAML